MSLFAQHLATVFRQSMIEQTEKLGQPQITRQWRAEWLDTDDAYRQVWQDVAKEAAAFAMPVEEQPPTPVEEATPLTAADFEPHIPDFEADAVVETTKIDTPAKPRRKPKTA